MTLISHDFCPFYNLGLGKKKSLKHIIDSIVLKPKIL